MDEKYISPLANKELSVSKANALIQKTRHNLSMQQQKVLLYLISLIDKDDSEFKLYEFETIDFCNQCSISYAGKNYSDIKNAIQGIADKSFWLMQDDGIETLVRFVDTAEINHNLGTIKIKLNDKLKPYLLHLKDHYTQYALKQVLQLDSKYSIRLYEFISSIHYYTAEPYERDFSLEYIKTVMGAEIYKDFFDFNKRALQPALQEINEKTDKKVECCFLKNRRKIVGLDFWIEQKETKTDDYRSRIRELASGNN